VCREDVEILIDDRERYRWARRILHYMYTHLPCLWTNVEERWTELHPCRSGLARLDGGMCCVVLLHMGSTSKFA
jgi:hypothetical protein